MPCRWGSYTGACGLSYAGASGAQLQRADIGGEPRFRDARPPTDLPTDFKAVESIIEDALP